MNYYSIKTNKLFYETTDGKEFLTTDFNGWEGEWFAIKHEKALADESGERINDGIAISRLKKIASYTTSDGKTFNGEFTTALREAQTHQEIIDSHDQGEILADIFYPGEMTKSEYARHLTNNMPRLREIFPSFTI